MVLINMSEILKEIPSVDSIIKSDEIRQYLSLYPRNLIIKAIREALESLREGVLKGIIRSKEEIYQSIYLEVERFLRNISAFSLKRVINATGIVIHTNLGRAILSERAIKNVSFIAGSYSNLEYNIEEGKRGKRDVHCIKYLREITSAPEAFIVNNNAGAVLISLNTIAQGKEVIISRGELVEIGGSFRMPDVMRLSGAILKEVGTTNKTHLHDYRNAITENTALILKVHTSNFRMSGFVKSVEIEELVKLGREYGIPVMYDLGSGCLIDLKRYGIYGEPSVIDILGSGVDLLTFSGDKLLGGPQAGIILGKKELIEKIRRSPLARALRIDKLTLSALEATLFDYLDPEKAVENIPALRALLDKPNNIMKRAKRILNLLLRKDGIISIKKLRDRDTQGEDIRAYAGIIEDYSQAGGGALPEVNLKTYAVAIKPVKVSLNHLIKRMRLQDPPVVGRIKDDLLLLDARTIQEKEIKPLVESIINALF